MSKMSTKEVQIAERAERYASEPLTNLHNFIDAAFLLDSFRMLNKRGASGVDGETWATYDEEKEERLPALLDSFKSGRYRAPKVRRVYIPKADGGERPLGLPTVEDKILQTAVSRVLNPIYEREFYDNSYGFRAGRSPKDALERLFREVSFRGKRYIIDADMKNYFGTIDHKHLRAFLRQRIRDKVVERMIGKWLKAGILDAGQVSYPKSGAPQGGSISPLLSNIYLHYVLDEWFIEQIQPLLQGDSTLIRYADDFLLLFENKDDAYRVMKVLSKRLGKYGLSLHPDKTRLIELDSPGQPGPRSFDFLGFTHYMGNSRKGKRILKRKTSSKKYRLSLKRTGDWIKRNRHLALNHLIHNLNAKLRGHYSYYGITFNSRMINNYYEAVKRVLFKWLNRRGGKHKLVWARYAQLVEEWLPLLKPKIYHKYNS